MFRTIFFQVGALLVAVVLCGVVVGGNGALSAALGGAAYTLPAFLFAVRLRITAARPGASYALAFFLGEFIKIAATIGFLVVIVKLYPGLHWPTMLIGLAVALQANFLALMKRS